MAGFDSLRGSFVGGTPRNTGAIRQSDRKSPSRQFPYASGDTSVPYHTTVIPDPGPKMLGLDDLLCITLARGEAGVVGWSQSWQHQSLMPCLQSCNTKTPQTFLAVLGRR